MKTLLVALVFAELSFAAVAPTFRGATLEGKKAALEDYLKPNRGLLVCFWASWCSPCIEEMRKVSLELKNNPNLNLDVITVNVDSTETFGEVKPTVKGLDLKFPVIVDRQMQIFSKFQSEQTLPYSVLMGPDRTILQPFNGYQEDMFEVIKAKLKTLEPSKEEKKADEKKAS